MKKILGIVAGIVGIISVIVGVALKMNNNAIAIIGGADGPTSVFVAGKLNNCPPHSRYFSDELGGQIFAKLSN
ncbi:hypothetical protein [Blautia sp.]|uniref:hypothetical protein n=1 Tax=Blautia sp. TaxID=1955243 RepID=UPI0025811262|nr:hypothetical protein [Blautia sp.]